MIHDLFSILYTNLFETNFIGIVTSFNSKLWDSSKEQVFNKPCGLHTILAGSGGS